MIVDRHNGLLSFLALGPALVDGGGFSNVPFIDKTKSDVVIDTYFVY